MKIRFRLFSQEELDFEFAPYSLAEGNEEQRIKRQILRKINKHRSSAVADVLEAASHGHGLKNNRNHA